MALQLTCLLESLLTCRKCGKVKDEAQVGGHSSTPEIASGRHIWTWWAYSVDGRPRVGQVVNAKSEPFSTGAASNHGGHMMMARSGCNAILGMRRIAAHAMSPMPSDCEIEFVTCAAASTSGKVNWGCRVALSVLVFGE